MVLVEGGAVDSVSSYKHPPAIFGLQVTLSTARPILVADVAETCRAGGVGQHPHSPCPLWANR